MGDAFIRTFSAVVGVGGGIIAGVFFLVMLVIAILTVTHSLGAIYRDLTRKGRIAKKIEADRAYRAMSPDAVVHNGVVQMRRSTDK